MRKRFKNTLYLITFLVVCLVVLGIFYFVYKKYLSNSSIIELSGPLSINYIDGNKLKLNGTETITFSIINDSSDDAYYYIEFKNPKNIKKTIKYTLTNGEDINITEEVNNYNTIISSFNLIKGGEIENFQLTFEPEEKFNYSLELNINTENLETNTFGEVVLKDNEIKEKPLTTPGIEVATSEEGLIKSTDDYGTTYYFRGASSKNYVSINDMKFRIVRVNGDGTVRLIYDGQTEDLKKYYETYEKYDYKQSIISTTLNAWVSNNLGEYISYLANQKFCNDTNMENNSFFALSRIKTDNIPSFVCLGDKVLSKVGLLTADEVIYAGATLNDDNQNYYLYNENVTESYYTMTSASLINSAYYPFMINTSGKLITSTSGGNLGAVRPVINIIKTATVTGSGTVNDPYVLTG